MIEFTPSSVYSQLAVVTDANAVVPAKDGLRCMGYSIRESNGVAAIASVRIVHGATVAGTPIANINVLASSSDTHFFGDGGIACPQGISIDFIAGVVDVVIFYKTY
jgi:hypothetical protein